MKLSEKPALLGGTPTIVDEYGNGCKHGPEAVEALRRRLSGGGRLPLAMGPSIRQFRSDAESLLGVSNVIPASSGSAAIHAGLAALNIAPGDEVVTSPITDAGTVLGILQLQAIPVFADVDPFTFMPTVEHLAGRISGKTRCLLPVHYHGTPADMDSIMELARREGLHVLEDCAQSWMARWKGRLVGTFGQAGAFSMNESKHLSVGEGGILTTNDAALARRADLFIDKSYDRSGEARMGPATPAVNYRMSEITGSLAIAQLQKLVAITDRRHQLGERLADSVESLPGLRLVRSPSGGVSTYWHGLLHVDADQADATAGEFAKMLAAEGVRCYPFEPVNLLETPLFKRLNQDPRAFHSYQPPGLKPGAFSPESCPNAAAIPGNALTITINEFISDGEMSLVIEAIEKISRWFQHTNT